jgi:DNA replication protein DnaC
VTSNLDVSEWGEAFPNKLLGAATIDRLRHGAYKVVLNGISFRSPRNGPKTSKNDLCKQPKSALVKGGEKG